MDVKFSVYNSILIRKRMVNFKEVASSLQQAICIQTEASEKQLEN